MSPPPWSTSPSTMSSTSSPGTPLRANASATAYLARSNALTSTSVPLRAVPIGVRQAETITASVIRVLLVPVRGPVRLLRPAWGRGGRHAHGDRFVDADQREQA